jgi:WD40 repeat protein/biotin carboxyl carrier protein
MKRLAGVPVLGLVGLTLWATAQTPPLPRKTIVVTDCRIRPVEDVEVPARVPGVLSEVLVKRFGVVKKGQVIAKIDDRLALIELASKKIAKENEAPKLEAEATEEEYAASLEEQTQLQQKGAASSSTVRLHKARVKVAQRRVDNETAKLDQAAQEYKAAKTQVEMHAVTSPIDGVVVEVYKYGGEAVEAREKVVRVIRDDIVRIEGAVDALEAAHLRPGMPVEVVPNITLASSQHYRHTAAVNAVKVVGAGDRCVSADQLGVIHVWNVAQRTHEKELRGHERAVQCLAVCPTDPNTLASAGEDRAILVWDLSAGASTPIPTNGSPVLSAVWHPTQPQLLVTGHEDRKIRVWDVKAGREITERYPLEGPHTGFVTSLAMTPDGRYLLSTGNDQTVQVWDFDAGKPLYGAFRGRSPEVRQIGISPDGQAFLFNSYDLLQIRSIRDGTQRSSLESRSGPFSDVAVFAPESGFVLTAATNRLELWRPGANGRPSRLVRSYEGHSLPIRSVDFAPDGAFFVSGSEDHSVRIWEVPNLAQAESERVRGVVVLHQSVDPASQKLALYTEVENPGAILQPGRFATMVIVPGPDREHAGR